MKKFIAILLSTVMIFTCSAGTYADDGGLADAISKAKEYVEVPEDQSDIEFNILYQDDGVSGYQLRWYNEDDYSSVSLDLDGCLLSYYVSAWDEDETNSLANYTMEQTEKTAEEFLKKVYGNHAGCFRLSEKLCNTDSHVYRYTAYQNDIPIAGSYAVIRVNSFNDTVYNFNGCQQEFFSLEYPEPIGVIEPEDAMLRLYDNNYPLPSYRISTTYETNEIERSVFLAFYTSDRGKGIDAFTGELTDINYISDTGTPFNAAASGTAESSADEAATFTPEELEAIASVKNLISLEQAVNIIKDCFPIAGNEEFSNYRIYSDRDSGKYFIQLNTDNAKAVLDGESGIVQSFSYYGIDDTEFERDYTATAAELISKAAYDIEDQLSPVDTIDGYLKTIAGYRASRTENGYKCLDEGITIYINIDGYVNTYYRTWYDDLNYPDPDNVLSGEAAVNALEDVFDFDLVYSVDKDYNVSLAYTFGKFGYMSATSPQRLNYNGEIMEEEIEPSIADVRGHWAEKYITPLFNSGYQITDTAFKPDQSITYGELKELFGENYNWAFYSDTEETEKPDDSTVTKYELAEYIVNYCGFSELMDHPDIFVSKFNDEIDRRYLPAVAIVYGFNILTGDENNCFNGEKKITRAEAAVALYNLLCREN